MRRGLLLSEETKVVSSEFEGVNVWTVAQDAPAVGARLAAYESALPAAEQQRATRFVQVDDRIRFVLGRTLARTMLSRYASVSPGDWPIEIDERGRPELRRRLAGVPDLRFNLSHTPGLIACAVTIGREVGIDVEYIGRQLLHDNIPERFFSAQEVTDLRALPADEQPRAFFDYWTLKEAYIKARGLGLALPLGQFTFRCRSNGPTRIEFAPELVDDPASWQFAQYWPTPHHRMAVAVRRSGDDVPIRVSAVVPEVVD
jgi:4'-phosphopantetheinyl transferase